MVKRIKHWVAHRFGWNTGSIELWWEGPKLVVGFRCDGCGKMQGIHDTGTRAPC